MTMQYLQGIFRGRELGRYKAGACIGGYERADLMQTGSG